MLHAKRTLAIFHLTKKYARCRLQGKQSFTWKNKFLLFKKLFKTKAGCTLARISHYTIQTLT